MERGAYDNKKMTKSMSTMIFYDPQGEVSVPKVSSVIFSSKDCKTEALCVSINGIIMICSMFIQELVSVFYCLREMGLDPRGKSSLLAKEKRLNGTGVRGRKDEAQIYSPCSCKSLHAIYLSLYCIWMCCKYTFWLAKLRSIYYAVVTSGNLFLLKYVFLKCKRCCLGTNFP